MTVIDYDDSRKGEWDAFVASNSEAWVGHVSSVFDFERETRGAANHSQLIIGDREQIIGLLPLFEIESRRMRVVKTRILSSGSHLRSGPLFDGSLSPRQRDAALTLLIQAVRRKAAQLDADTISLSYPNVVGSRTSLEHYHYLPLKQFGFREQNGVTMIVDLTKDVSVLHENLKRSFRKYVRRCEEEGGEFRIILDREAWLGCYDLNVATLGANSYSRKALEMIWDGFVETGYAMVTATVKNESVLSVAVAVYRGASSYRWIGFNSHPQVIGGAHNLLSWKTLCLFKERGFRYFEVGSMAFSDQKQIGISRFKEGLGGTPMYSLSGTLDLKPGKSAGLDMLATIASRLRRRSVSSHEERD